MVGLHTLQFLTVTTVICHNVKYKFYLLSRISMNYNISGDKAPIAPTPGKGTKCIKLLCFQA